MNKGRMIKMAAAAASVLLMGTDASAYTMKKRIGDVDTSLKIYGFAQLEARGGDGVIKDEDNAVSKFGAQRVRLGANYTAGQVRGKLFLDFNRPHDDASGVGLPDMIKDAFVTYYENKALAVKVGLIKMPHGMGFTIPGWNLDVVERGFDKKLAMERNVGIMLSGRDLGFGNKAKVNGFEMGHERPWKGFGYDIMIANQAGRSGAVTNANPGDANSYAARLMFDWTELLHTELSYAVSQNAGGVAGYVTGTTSVADTETGAITTTNTVITEDTEDYKSINFGIDSHFGPGNAKFEFYDAKNIKGIKDYDEQTWALTGTYYVNDYLEPAVKHIQGSSDKGGVETDLGNTYIGLNFYISPFDNKMDRGSKRKRNAHRMQFNYVVASGDKSTWNGLGGYKDDAWLFQYQYKY
jgi:hypothetical protein